MKCATAVVIAALAAVTYAGAMHVMKIPPTCCKIFLT